jgi:hypothetical protein
MRGSNGRQLDPLLDGTVWLPYLVWRREKRCRSHNGLLAVQRRAPDLLLSLQRSRFQRS